MGIDDGDSVGGTNSKVKQCDKSFGFEGDDDYCICGSGSREEVPGDIPDTSCNDICGSPDDCIIGIDDGDSDGGSDGIIRKCDKKYGFEGDDDYCVCGDISETQTPAD